MANKNQKGLLIALGVGVGGFALYKYMQSKNADVVDTSAPGALPPPSNPSTAPGAATNNQTNVAPSTQTGSNTSAVSQSVYNTVLSWVQADNKPPSAALLAANIPSEMNGMAAIIAGGWNPTTDQRTFWNAIVNKYDPQRKYW